MIKSITGGSGVVVNGPSFGMPYVDSTRPSAGMMRYKDYQFEVYDGTQWLVAVAGAPNICLDNYVLETIEWARKKMAEEAEVNRLASGHPAIQIALDNFKKAKQQLDATIILSKEHDKETTS